MNHLRARIARFAWGAALLGATAGCTAQNTVGLFEGAYGGSYTGSYNITNPAPDNQPQAGTGNVNILPGTGHDLVVDLQALVPNCSMQADGADTQGFSAPPGQVCLLPSTSPTTYNTTLTLTLGTGFITGSALTIVFDGHMTGTLAGHPPIAGSFSFTYMGQKL